MADDTIDAVSEVVSDTPEKLWWHVYGGIVTEHAVPAWVSKMYAESTMPVGDLPASVPYPDAQPWTSVPYLKSFDHEPTAEERAALIPERP